MTTSNGWTGLEEVPPVSDFLAGPGRMETRFRAFDWSQTALGAPETWPGPLKANVRMMLGSRQPVCICWGPELITLYNNAFAPFLGVKDRNALGQSFQTIWAEIWDDLLPFVRKALSGVGTWVEDLPLFMNRYGFQEETYWTFSYSPLHDADGRIAGFINIATDATPHVLMQRRMTENMAKAQEYIAEHQVADRQNVVLHQEMQHRIKNMLAMVSAVVSQSLRHSSSLKEAGETIGSRIMALGRAQDILTQSDLVSADIAAIVKAALSPHIDSAHRVTSNGPDIAIPAKQGLGLSLAIHELATNAVKYGALSVPAGTVDLSWQVSEGRRLNFVWQESGGPAVSAPLRSGFGSTLTGRVVAAYFNGTGQTFYEPQGIKFVLDGVVDRE
ncbi:sensor histidine kinase [Rhizobium halophytocola]|uniref:histidine kinase n=1 Tax=Rhizobium halophytocola TaxID=735519 RepID=A0ABS4E5Z0_9HYPH|nr:PAS domain-containing sensor histidine kinase [Rhizobium halophytocola]MBP1853333.1 two-component sensor histidine kinase [Rhizobium halophytocola]